MGFAWSSVHGSPYYGASSSTASKVPGVAPVALDGHAYLIDWMAETPLVHTAVETLREQFDASEEPGEVSLNREGLWRRSRSSWHLGQGQEFCDAEDSSRFRYHDGQGVNPWVENQLELLHEPVLKAASVNTNLYTAMVGTHFYWTDGTALRFYTDIVAGAPTNVTGVPGTAPTSIATNGFHVWTAHGASGIYRTTRGAATTASHITGTVSLLGYVRNRVLAANGPTLYDVSTLAVGASGALPAAFFTHGNADFVWSSFAEGSGNIYAAGFSGDKSLIYRIGLTSDGTALTAPVVAAELPKGEIVTNIYGYLGKFIVVGTTVGWRFAIVTESGDLSLGARVETPMPIVAFWGEGEFIYFSWGGFSASDTGIGRMSTAAFSDVNNLVPAYASDLMVPGSANIQGIATMDDRLIFTVSGQGLYYEGDDCVEEGFFTSGKVTFSMTETKLAMWADCQHLMHHGSFEFAVSVDDEDFVVVGTRDADIHPLPSLGLGQAEFQTIELRITLRRDAVEMHMCPRLLSWLLRVQPRPEVTNLIYATIILAPEVDSDSNTTALIYDTRAEREFIKELHRSKQVAPWQQGDEAFSIIVENYRFDYAKLIHYPNGPAGSNSTCALKMKQVS